MKRLARLATAALLAELETTPKPGLVDLEHRGAHRDLSLERLRESALALEEVFAAIARTARGAAPSIELREELGAIGRSGERAMLRASGGTNTHRGALWALGLLVAGHACVASVPPQALGPPPAFRPARTPARRTLPEFVVRAASLATLPDRFAGSANTHGASVRRRYGVGGAVSEASAGFPHVVNVALPLLRRNVAPADVLLALLAVVDDTCTLHRGGRAGARLAQAGARAAIRAGGTATPAGRSQLRLLDATLVAHNISPGGCADLLAAGLFVAAGG